MLSELAPVMTTTLSLIPDMKICFLASARSQLSTLNSQLLALNVFGTVIAARSLCSKQVVTNCATVTKC